jgi:hypothetical protein
MQTEVASEQRLEFLDETATIYFCGLQPGARVLPGLCQDMSGGTPKHNTGHVKLNKYCFVINAE